ncbi:Wadjet anti-phage system protein JetD domain-containing protein [Castellaniella caeni]
MDTHGFAILHRARSYIPGLQSVLMDEGTRALARGATVGRTRPI